jgi:hypothetical protein
VEEEKALARQGVDAYFKSKLHALNRALRRLHNPDAKPVRLEVDRNDVFRDSFRAFSRLSGDQLRGPLHVKFRKEDGRDDGGLTRHWFLLISREIVNPEYAMFAPVGSGNSSYQVRLQLLIPPLAYRPVINFFPIKRAKCSDHHIILEYLVQHAGSTFIMAPPWVCRCIRRRSTSRTTCTSVVPSYVYTVYIYTLYTHIIHIYPVARAQVHPASKHQPHHLEYFRFIGRVLGKAIFDGFLIEAHLASTVYKFLLGLEIASCDMASVDPVYFKNLQASSRPRGCPACRQ